MNELLTYRNQSSSFESCQRRTLYLIDLAFIKFFNCAIEEIIKERDGDTAEIYYELNVT